MLVLAVWLDAFEQLIAQYGGRLAGKVTVGPTNLVGPDGDGGYRKLIGEQESSGRILAGRAGALRIPAASGAGTARWPWRLAHVRAGVGGRGAAAGCGLS